MVTTFTLAFFAAYKVWWTYTHAPGAAPPANWDTAIRASYRQGPSPGIAGLPPPVQPAPTALAPVLRHVNRPPLARPATVPQAALLAPVPGLPGPGHPTNWVGVKHLGNGTFGNVTLWEYVGLAPLGPLAPTRIAMKTTDATIPNNELRDEGRYLNNLIPPPPALPWKHIVHLIVYPPDVMTAATALAQGVPGGWATRVRRLILEYCPQGSLRRLFKERVRRNLRFEELTLWRLFDCLVDGCLVMEYQSEADVAAGVANVPVASVAGTVADPGVMVHFDLKPGNILSGDRDPTHTDTPVFKIADFGLAQYMARKPANVPVPNGFANCNRNRRMGTANYFAPEQFSDEWNYSGHAANPVCGKYGTATNVWGIGCILYKLACFNKGAPEPWLPFLATPASLTIHGAPAQGVLYGTHLQGTAYSKVLKDTIQECLYERPAHRPSLIQLKNTILTNIQALAAPPAPAVSTAPEPWKDLDCPEPLTRYITPFVFAF